MAPLTKPVRILPGFPVSPPEPRSHTPQRSLIAGLKRPEYALWKQTQVGWFIATLWWPLLAPAQFPAEVPVGWTSCFRAAGIHYGIAPELLMAIARVESRFDPSAWHANPDGSWDIGLMQINTRWLPVLQANGLTPESLYEPCTSIWVGAWVLAGNIARYGYEWQAVGAYNAGTAATPVAHARREAYARQVARRLVFDAADGAVLRE